MTRLKTLPFLLLLLAFGATGPWTLRAQPVAVQQIQNIQLTAPPGAAFPGQATATNVPELYQGENADVGPQHILRLVPRHPYFNLLLDSQVFYTDNANFAPTADKIGSTIFVNTVQAAFTPTSLTLGEGKLSSNLGVASQWYNYENPRMSPLDFNAQTVFIGGKYLIGHWLVSLDASGTRLVNQSDYYQTYREFLPVLGVQRFIPLTQNVLLTLGNQTDYHFSDQPATLGTDAQINNHFDDIVSLTLTWQITPHLVLQPAYRFMYSYYEYNTLQNTGRDDLMNSLGVSLSYFFNQNCSLRTFFNYNVRTTDDRFAAAYHETDGGLGAALNILF